MKIYVSIENTKYFVNKNKKTVVCVLTVEGFGQGGTFRGIAKCSPEDSFDEIKGKRIAESRAKEKLYRGVAKIYKDLAKEYANKSARYRILQLHCEDLSINEKEHITKLCEE